MHSTVPTVADAQKFTKNAKIASGTDIWRMRLTDCVLKCHALPTLAAAAANWREALMKLDAACLKQYYSKLMISFFPIYFTRPRNITT